MALFSRRRRPAAGSPLAALMDEGRAGLDAAQLVQALARSVVHVPVPDDAQASPTMPGSVEAASEVPPRYVVDDDDGRFVLVFSTPERLGEAFSDDVEATSVPFPALLDQWP